jgi:uncharacterized protein (DUF305 family)
MRWRVALLVVALCALAAKQDQTTVWCRSGFLSESHAAMEKMQAGMEIQPSGDVDRDFAAMMIAHHQGAIDMAQAELRHGNNELLRRLAQEIVVEQTQEIAAMGLALK